LIMAQKKRGVPPQKNAALP